KSDSPDPVPTSGNISYSIQVYNDANSTNSGADAASVSFSDPVPANTTLVSVTVPGGWTRTDSVPAGGTGTITATTPSIAAGNSSFITIVVKVDPATALGTTISNTATATSTTPDPDGTNNSGSTTTRVA